MSYLQALTDPRNQEVRAWWSDARYAAAYHLARAALAAKGVTALQAGVCGKLAISETSHRDYLAGAIPSAKSMLLIDAGLRELIGPAWMGDVDRHIEKEAKEAVTA